LPVCFSGEKDVWSPLAILAAFVSLEPPVADLKSSPDGADELLCRYILQAEK
jgi:hypothetical protein